MSRVRVVLVVLIGLPLLGADDPAPAVSRRVISGRCVAGDGKPPATGRIYFRPDDRLQKFLEAWSAPLDAEGRYRVELVDTTQRSMAGEMVASRAAGPLRFEVLAPGYRAESGVVAAPPGPGPLTWDVALAAEPWRETEYLLLDAAGQPVADGEVTQEMAGSKAWARVRADDRGICRVSNPPGRAYGIAARRPGSAVTQIVASGTADEPRRVLVPIRDPIRGRVVDPAGRPAAGLRLGRVIAMDDGADDPAARGRLDLFPFLGVEGRPATDADGRYTLDLPVPARLHGAKPNGELRLFPQALCFADGDGRRVAFVALDRQNPRPAYDITLAPARPVRWPVEHTVTSASGQRETGWSLYARTDALGAATLVQVMSGSVLPGPGGGDRIDVTLPPGSYEIQISSADPKADKLLGEAKSKFEVPPGEGPLDLPPVSLTPQVHTGMVGKPAPEIDATDLDTGAPVRLADFRGRVVVLDFWGAWCGPCLKALPELAKLHDEFAGRPVTILAVHDQSVRTRAEYDAKLGAIRRMHWGGRDLPFRVALDAPAPGSKPDDPGIASGVSVGRYEVSLWPTTLLIDPQGRVAEVVNPRDREAVAARIRALLDAPAKP